MEQKSFEIKTVGKLQKGKIVNALVINYSIGGHNFSRTPTCFPKQLKFKGLDEKGIAQWQENIVTIRDGFSSNKWVDYNDGDNFFVVGIIPEKIKYPFEIEDRMLGKYHWKKLLKIEDITPIETNEDNE